MSLEKAVSIYKENRKSSQHPKVSKSKLVKDRMM